ncbi:hypothetical protein [Candidatus Parabeggiatoa sp. HSG14]|uniref:hypothetical protein n=1 Tax=Candidatus Parabeggiatoa sp. HSG14 TaxID=3055593 RepID=UPI0025A8A703|nr:hypothetical protein [Thiotrichales bacterium HSG14]
MNSKMKQGFLVLNVYFALLYILPLEVKAFACEFAEDSYCFIRQYKVANSTDEKYERVNRVHNIFDKVLLVVDKSPIVTQKNPRGEPTLFVLKKGPIDPAPFAIALPKDGSIILSKTAIDKAYNDGIERGDIRIAFVLGHELAHLSKSQLSHFLFSLKKGFRKDMFSPLNPHPLSKKFKELVKLRNEEKRADEQGFLYAAMAGYAVDKLLKGKIFLIEWQKQIQSRLSTHPTPIERENFLIKRLKGLLDKLPYFQFGVRLAHFNQCAENEALMFFKVFKKDFSSREVLNNEGYCYLQRAREELGANAYFYWLPTVLDVATRIETFSLPLRAAPSEEAKAWLEKARDVFHKASQRDPFYIPAQINMLVTLFYLNEMANAQNIIENALYVAEKQSLASEIHKLKGLKALIQYEITKNNVSLKALATQQNELSILYNIARIEENNALWQKLAQHQTELPKPIRDVVCKKVACLPLQELKKIPKKWVVSIDVGERIRDNHVQKILQNWHKVPSPLQTQLNLQIYQYRKNDEVIEEVLEMDGFVEMVVLKQSQKQAEDLKDYCGLPLQSRQVTNGELLSCDNLWTAKVIDGKVAEIWIKNQ